MKPSFSNFGLSNVMAMLVAMSVAISATLLVGCGTNAPQPEQNSQLDIYQRSDGSSDARKRAAIRLELAIGHFQERRFDIALDELKQALKLEPNYAEALGVLAMVYMELGEKALAEQNFKRALQLKADDSDLNNNYGWFLCSNGREKDAIAYFMNALKNPLYQNPALPWQNAGVCSLRINDRVAAEQYLMRSFELDPGSPVTTVNLGRIFFERGELERARFYVAQVNKTPLASPDSLWLGIKIAQKLGQRGETASLTAQLQRLYPNSREANWAAHSAYDK